MNKWQVVIDLGAIALLSVASGFYFGSPFAALMVFAGIHLAFRWKEAS